MSVAIDFGALDCVRQLPFRGLKTVNDVANSVINVYQDLKTDLIPGTELIECLEDQGYTSDFVRGVIRRIKSQSKSSGIYIDDGN